MKPFVVAIGELLWDLLPEGKQLGGAPGNVVHHVRELGGQGALISRVGKDALGVEAAERVGGLQRDDSAPTGTAQVSVDRDGQPKFELVADVAWDRIEADSASRALVARADAVCFGTLAQRQSTSRTSIRALLEACRPGGLRLLDINLRDPFWTEEVVLGSLERASALKINDAELDRCSSMLKLTGDPRARIDQLAKRYRLQLVALTRGYRGSLLYAQGRWSDHPGLKVAVRDAVGAGDAFTAALILGTLRGADLDAINRHANEVGAYVCTQPGATPRLPEKLRSE